MRYLFIMLFLALSLTACGKSRLPTNVKGPDTKAVTGSLDSINRATNSIDSLTKDTPVAPQVKEQTNSIRDETQNLASSNEQTDMLYRALAREQEARKAAESRSSRLIQGTIAGAYALGILAVALGFFLRAPSISLGGVGAIAGAAVASFVFTWAWAIGLTVLVGAAVWYLFVQRKAIKQLVLTGEAVKATLDAGGAPEATDALYRSQDSVANQVQSPATKSIVKQVRKGLKRAAQSKAPATGGEAQ